MLGYYVYTLDKDGHVTGRTAIMCEGDEEAKVQAKALVDGYIVELWGTGLFPTSVAGFEDRSGLIRLVTQITVAP